MDKQISYREFKLAYRVFGSGDEVVLAFHGHGRPASDFEFISNMNYRVVSVELFFHGNSFYPEHRLEKNPISWEELIPLFSTLLETEKLAHFHCIAFSQGGRFALKILETFPEKIETFTLIASDGLNFSTFYNRTAQIKFARILFDSLRKKPARLQKVSEFVRKLKVVRPKVHDFFENIVSDPESYDRAVKTWIGFRKIRNNPKLIGELVRKYSIPFQIIMGKYDQVIRPKQAEIFLNRTRIKTKIVIIENGHDFFKPSSVEKFREILLIYRNL